MDRPCVKAIKCPGPIPGLEADSPLTNYSSEQTDGAEFTSRRFVYVDPYDPAFPGWWVGTSCNGLFECVSLISQDDANMCAQRLADLCSMTPPTPPPDGGNECDYDPASCTPVAPQIFYNTQQTCLFPCPDGVQFFWTIPAGSFVATSQELADRLAVLQACYLASRRALCFSAISSLPCVNQAWAGTISVTGTTVPFRFSLVGGSLPPGILFQQISNRSARFFGTCPTPGHYFVTVRATSREGWSFQKTYDIGVLGITNDSVFPQAAVGAAYNEQLTADGGTPPYTFAVASGTLPDGLTLDPSGLLSGTPTTEETQTVTFSVSDSST